MNAPQLPPPGPGVLVPDTLAGPRAGSPDGDLRRFWSAYAVSALGSGIGTGALSLIAILVLHVPDWQVSALAVTGGLAAVAVTAPLGGWIEFHRKRPVMIGADLLRGAALASVPAAALLHLLTYAQLCVVAVAQTAGTILSTSASSSYLKHLTPPRRRAQVNGWLETTSWTSSALGPPAGGLLIAATSPTASMLIDATSFVLSACGWRRIRTPEPPPPQPTAGRHPLAEAVDGWRYILTHPQLRALYLNSQIFGGAIMASSPLITVYLLRDLHFSTAQYGLALGLPCAAGAAGALAAPRLIRTFGLTRTMLAAGAARCLWMSPILLARPNIAGLALIIGADSALLLCAGIFNPAFATFRMAVTADTHQVRVVAAWAVTSKTIQPVCIAAAGLLAATTGVRTAIAVLSVVLLISALLLPWTTTKPPPSPSPSPTGRRA